MNDETMCRLALQFLPSIGGTTVKKLLCHYGSAAAIFADKSKNSLLLRRGVPLVLSEEILQQVKEEYQWMQSQNIKICFYTDSDYPRRLKNCYDAPYLFYYQGENIFNERRMVAVVGTRAVTPYGKEVTRRLIEELQPYRVCIVSGLAYGVDTVAHEQALNSGMKTIAVMGSGFRMIYPAENKKLAMRILEDGGALVTEFPYHTKPDRQNFPQRNRIIAGLCEATVVMETAAKGGSIITAQIANSYNRDVFAVPGSIFAPASEGCNQLIRKNIAAVVTSGTEIAEMMGWDIPQQTSIQRSLFVELNEEERKVFEMIEQTSNMSIDDILVALPQYSPSKIAALLLQLELKGIIQCTPGKCYKAL